MDKNKRKIAYFHLPGLFEFYDLYYDFLALYREHREYFYEWCKIGSIYGAPASCLWGGGRVGSGQADSKQVFELMQKYGISSRLTFSNSLIRQEHVGDEDCNELCRVFYGSKEIQNGIIVHSEMLLEYLKKQYPDYYYISSTTKVLTEFSDFVEEVNREEFDYVVPDFRLNKDFSRLKNMTQNQKDKVEFLCNECCWFACTARKECYENVSLKNLGEACEDHICVSPNGERGYRFSDAMNNEGFISLEGIYNIYLPMGFSNFKIEGRELGSAMVLEFLLYYLVKPECHIYVREALYLDAMLDLF